MKIKLLQCLSLIILCAQVDVTVSYEFQGLLGRFYQPLGSPIPFLIRADDVEYNFCSAGEGGACLDEQHCASEGVQIPGSCAKVHQVCCKVVKTCGEKSSSHSVRFQTPSFPKNETGPHACVFTSVIGPDICALRVNFDVFELSKYKKDLCPYEALAILGTNKIVSLLCGNMTGWSSTFAVKPFSEITISGIGQGVTPYRYSLALTMIACRDIIPFKSQINAGLINQESKPYKPPTTKKPKRKGQKPPKRTFPTRGDTKGQSTSTPLPVGKLKPKSTAPPVDVRSIINHNEGSDLDFLDRTSDSIFRQIFNEKVGNLTCDPVSVPSFGEDGHKCWFYDTITDTYRRNDECFLESCKHEASFRIIGGKFANINEFPWQIWHRYLSDVAYFGYHEVRSLISEGNLTTSHSLEVTPKVALIYKKKFFCGGALISNKFVMTASHCVFGSFPTGIDGLRVSVGDHDLMTKNETTHKLSKVKRIIWNVHFNSLTTENDIAILELAEPVEFSAQVLPINLPSDDYDYAKQNATVTGWGRNNLKSRKMSPVLKEYTAAIDDIDTCVKQWTPYPKIGAIKDMHLCLNITYGTPCHGDSGGPLVSCSQSQRCTLIGLVSFGFPLCRNIGLPAVFTRVTAFRRWVDLNTSPIFYTHPNYN